MQWHKANCKYSQNPQSYDNEATLMEEQFPMRDFFSILSRKGWLSLKNTDET